MDRLRVHSAPENIHQFVDEIAPGYGRLYGTMAMNAYREQAPAQLAATIAHREIRAYATVVQGAAQALLFVWSRPDRHVITFFHTLDDCEAGRSGAALIDYALGDLPSDDKKLVITDYIPFMEHDFDAAYRSLGFQQVKRQLMVSSETSGPDRATPGYLIRSANAGEAPELARVLSATYAGHSEKALFEEVQSAEAAEGFLGQCLSGAYGSCHAGGLIGAWKGDDCVGLAVGTEVVAGMGFVLHMAVLPGHQGRGIGQELLGTLTRHFQAHGLTRVALGVTSDNPALRLYRRAGFDTLRAVPVYYRPPFYP